jgi:hypothetical protein
MSLNQYIHLSLRILQAAMQFPELRDYTDLWPVTDMVRLSLKYTSGRASLNDKVFHELKRLHKKQ